MSLKEWVGKLASDLETWSNVGINEAQTSQAIILPLLRELGYDIWNPLEVVAQSPNLGYIPDYTVELDGKIRFIIEVKALNKTFSDNDQAQAVNYVNAQGRRWAILTDGRTWHFYDNQITKPASEKLALTVDLQHKRAASYLNTLLARAFWLTEDADTKLAALVNEVDEDIRKRIKLGEIEAKLELELEEGFMKDEKGLEKAIQFTLEPNEKELANEAFQELATRLLVNDDSPNSGLALAIKQGIAKTSPTQRDGKTSGLEAWIGGEGVHALSWRDITTGIAEALITMKREDVLESLNLIYSTVEDKKKKGGEVYPPHAYRELSNGRFLYVHFSASDHISKTKKLLGQVNAPANMLKVIYKENTYELP